MEQETLSRREFIQLSALAAATMAFPGALAQAADLDAVVRDYPVGDLEPVPALRQRQEWKQFIILVWQFHNDVRRDAALYERAGLHGFHIDRGAGEDELVRLSIDRRWPYYVDHAAGKGILYLNRDVKGKITGKASLQERPYSLADPKTIDMLKTWLRQNVGTTTKGLVYGYAFDDEISLGSFNTPIEVDIHPLSVAWYRRWLSHRYGSIAKLNTSWGKDYVSFETVPPMSFEDLRQANSAPPLRGWNLAPWMEWRHFMDYQFAQVLAGLTRYTNTLDPKIPAGFVGGQQPSAYGGFDYALLSRAVQWMESMDMGGSNEILRSLWNRPRRVRSMTYDGAGPYKWSVWLLWQRLARGLQVNIAWPAGWMRDKAAGTRELSPAIEQLAPTFREIQSSASEFIVHPDSYLEADPIGLYYSHPSIRAGWAMDSVTHGATWPRRSSSMDDDNLSSARLRLSWCKLLEDLGYQYDFVSYLDVEEGRVDLTKRFKVIILPQIICLSNREAGALREFVQAGGTLIADCLCGLLTETGRGRGSGALDDLFGIIRDEAKGYLNGKSITEVDAEYYDKPFPQRLRAYEGALRYRSMVVFERGTRSSTLSAGASAATAQVLMRRKVRQGLTLYLNLTPLAYAYFPFRAGDIGSSWRGLVEKELRDAGLKARVEIYGADGKKEPWIASWLWRNGARYCLAILKNIPESSDAPESISVIDQEPREIVIKLNFAVKELRNLRSHKHFGKVSSLTDSFSPWEANLYEFSLAK